MGLAEAADKLTGVLWLLFAACLRNSGGRHGNRRPHLFKIDARNKEGSAVEPTAKPACPAAYPTIPPGSDVVSAELT